MKKTLYKTLQELSIEEMVMFLKEHSDLISGDLIEIYANLMSETDLTPESINEEVKEKFPKEMKIVVSGINIDPSTGKSYTFYQMPNSVRDYLNTK